MPCNIEIKARISEPEALKARLKALVPEAPELLVQEDVFFHAPVRLKLRLLPDRAELIAYSRPDTPGPRASTYERTPVTHPDALRTVLRAALGERGIVRKRRWLYRYGQTRIHLDEVEGLGTFLELEVVLRPGQSPEDGERIARQLMHMLGIAEAMLVTGAYIDLLEHGDFRRTGG